MSDTQRSQSKPTVVGAMKRRADNLMTFSHGVINDYISAMNSVFVSLLFSKSISLILVSMHLLSFLYNVQGGSK